MKSGGNRASKIVKSEQSLLFILALSARSRCVWRRVNNLRGERPQRRGNTRYKNPQLEAQHCFVASFGLCVPFFILCDQLDPQQKHLLRAEETQRADWLICLSTSKFVAHQVVSLMKNEQQSQNLLLSRPVIYFSH